MAPRRKFMVSVLSPVKLVTHVCGRMSTGAGVGINKPTTTPSNTAVHRTGSLVRLCQFELQLATD